MGITAEQVLVQLGERLEVPLCHWRKRSIVTKNLSAMNKIDHRYIARMAELVKLGDPETLRITLNMLEEENFVSAFVSDTKFLNDEMGSKFNAATVMLDSLTLTLFVKKFRISVGLDETFFVGPVTSDHLIISARPSVRPDLMASSLEDAYQYCQSLAVASHVINPSRDKSRFISEVPDFIEWASTHPNREELLNASLRLNTLRKESLDELVAISAQTEPALRAGAI